MLSRRVPHSGRLLSSVPEDRTLNPNPKINAGASVWTFGISIFVVGLILTIVLCATDPAHIIRPLPPSISVYEPPGTSSFIYLTDNPYVYATELYANDSYVAMRWDVKGYLYHSNSSYYRDVAECSAPPCTLLIRKNTETDIIDLVLEFPGMIVEHIYANDTQLVVVGQGLVADGYLIPDATSANASVVQRDYADVAGIVIVYDRDTMTYVSSSIILPGDPSVQVSAVTNAWTPNTATFGFGRGFLDDAQLGVTFHGKCVGNWTLTPQLATHTTDGALDYIVECNRQQIVAVVYRDLVAQAVWHASAEELDDTHATVNLAKGNTTSIYLYGAYVADSVGGSTDAFPIPAWTTSPPPGLIAAEAAELTVDWTSLTPTSYVMQYDGELLYVRHLRFETGTNNVAAHANSTHFTIYGETMVWEELHVFDFTVSQSLFVGSLYDVSPEFTSPVGCVWNAATGAMIRCWLYETTVDATVSSSDPLILTVRNAGVLQRSDPWIAGANLTYTAEPITNVTDVLPGNSKSVESGNASENVPDNTGATGAPGSVKACDNERWHGGNGNGNGKGGVKFNVVV